MGFTELLESVSLCHLPHLGSLWSLFLHIFFSAPFVLSWNMVTVSQHSEIGTHYLFLRVCSCFLNLLFLLECGWFLLLCSQVHFFPSFISYSAFKLTQCVFIYLFLKIYFSWRLHYNIVVVLAYIDMNQPWVYLCSPSWTPFPLPSPSCPSGSSQCSNPEYLSHVSNLDWRSVSHMVIYMFQCYSLKSSHPCLLPESKSLFFTSVFLFLSHI